MPALSNSSAVSNVVSVKILHKESRTPIANILAYLFDVENWPDPESRDSTRVDTNTSLSLAPDNVAALFKTCDLIGSALTDDAGKCRFDVIPKDFNLPGRTEEKPDLLLVVLAPEEPGLDLRKRVLHFSRDVLFNAGTNEAYIILLPTTLLEEKGIPVGPVKQETRESVGNKVSAYIDAREREGEFNASVANYRRTAAAGETETRKVFRKDFLKQIATDLSSVLVTGAVANEGDNIAEKNKETSNQSIDNANKLLDNTDAAGVPVNLYLTRDD